MIAYQYSTTGADNVWAAARPDSAHTFSPPQKVVDSPGGSAPQAVGVAPDGAAYVLYHYQAAVSSQTYTGMIKLPPGGSWTSPTPVSPLGYEVSDGGIAFRGSDAFAVWAAGQQPATTNTLVEACRWPAGAAAPEAYRDLEPFSSALRVQQVLSDRAGSVLATWTKGSELRAATFDGGGPVLANSTIPSGLIAGVAASFSATFADLWSTVSGDPTWDFGDGTPAAGGGTVEHTYTAPGAYTVTTSAIDALGNQGAAMFSVNVGECEALAGVESLLCRCGNGLTIAACAGESLPAGLTKRFVAACGGVDAAQAAGAGRRGRKAAGRAVKGFKNARRALAAKAGRRLEARCRDGLAAVLATARENAVALKSTL